MTPLRANEEKEHMLQSEAAGAVCDVASLLNWASDGGNEAVDPAAAQGLSKLLEKATVELAREEKSRAFQRGK